MEKNIHIQLGNVLRARRQACGLSQTAAAKAIGLKHSQLSRFEAGAISPTLEQLAGLAERYGTTVLALLMEASNEQPVAEPPILSDLAIVESAWPDDAERLRREISTAAQRIRQAQSAAPPGRMQGESAPPKRRRTG